MNFGFSQKHIKMLALVFTLMPIHCACFGSFSPQMTILLPGHVHGNLLQQQCGSHCPGVRHRHRGSHCHPQHLRNKCSKNIYFYRWTVGVSSRLFGSRAGNLLWNLEASFSLSLPSQSLFPWLLVPFKAQTWERNHTPQNVITRSIN